MGFVWKNNKEKESAGMSLFSFIGGLFSRRVSNEPREQIEIYVGNLSYDMTSEQLRRAFARYGTVKNARVVENHYNHKSKGFGFVEMVFRREAETAIRALHDKKVMGRRLRVNEARNKVKA